MMPEQPLDPSPTPFDAAPYDPTSLPTTSSPTLLVSLTIKMFVPVGLISFGFGSRTSMNRQLWYDGSEIRYQTGLFSDKNGKLIPVKAIKAIKASNDYHKFVFRGRLGWVTIWTVDDGTDFYTALQSGPYSSLVQPVA